MLSEDRIGATGTKGERCAAEDRHRCLIKAGGRLRPASSDVDGRSHPTSTTPVAALNAPAGRRRTAPLFPNAAYVVGATAAARDDPHARDRASFLSRSCMLLEASGRLNARAGRSFMTLGDKVRSEVRAATRRD